MAVYKISRHTAVCFCYLFTYFVISNAINLDPTFSVIKRGKDNSYFGFSVAQHQILREPSTTVLENVLLIGAPKEIRMLGGKKSGGAFYRCDARSSDENCQVIEDGLSFPPSPSELVDDQWLGVTVASQGPGKQAVACAHRYVKDNAALGFCNVFTQELEYDGVRFRPCEKRPHVAYLKDFGLCQAGMSAAIGQDDAFVMGAPGSVFWRGVIFLTNVTNELGVSTTEINSPYKNKMELDAGEQETPTKDYSYNGYAVTMGRFDKTRSLYYVSGAPKSHNKGEVVFFRDLPKGTLRYEPSHIVMGPLEFSGFGSSLLALDLNKDGYDDLIVGAPYYYSRNHGGAFYVYLGGENMITSDTKPTEVLSRTLGDEDCEKLQCEHARFGISLTKLGDINMDSFEDFAVGAPYEGKGAVYIYYGANNTAGFHVHYAQRITAADLPVPDLMSFGYSLSGGMDLDENGYPDLLVGAYESDAVALIRSRPIIKIIPSLSVSPEAVDLEAKPMCNHTNVLPENKNRHCVAVKMCLSYTTKPANSIQVIPKVLYDLEAEPHRRVARVDLQGSMDAAKKRLKDKEIILMPNGDVCVTEIALIKGQFDDKLNPMEFRFNFSLVPTNTADPYPESAEQNINLFPVLDTQGADRSSGNAVSVQAEFVKECGDDNKCISNLQFEAKLQDVEKNASGIYEMVISRENHVNVEMKVSNEGEAAYLTRIYVQKPDIVTYIGTQTEDSVTCQGMKDDDTLIVCDQIGNPLRPDKTVYFILMLNMPRSMAETGELYNITAWVNTSSTESTPVSDTHVMKFNVINKAEIFLVTNVVPDNAILCQGEPRGASAMETEINIGASVKHNFIIRNSGPGVVSESYVKISWPYEVAGAKGGPGKYLLYLMRKPTITGPVIKCNDADIAQYINPLGIKEVIQSNSEEEAAITVDEVQPLDDGSRRKRAAEARQRRASGGVVVMSCDDGTANCFEYKCQLGKLEPNADYVKITMEARLWESTLLSDYRKAADVQIISWGELTVPKRLKITQDETDDRRRAITRAVPDFKETAGQTVQWWIILVAVLVGLIVLLVVIFILFKLGFFRRKRLEDMQMYKAEKKQQAMLQDEYDDDEGA